MDEGGPTIPSFLSLWAAGLLRGRETSLSLSLSPSVHALKVPTFQPSRPPNHPTRAFGGNGIWYCLLRTHYPHPHHHPPTSRVGNGRGEEARRRYPTAPDSQTASSQPT
ncbi:hypothetical protein B0T17DRAFT_505220 [Bombardia bombarda]|uniref:Uncharacterized protein n=1 Tax=Bombardia bombarda TaxID=252184 RepID=A0AA39X7W5_9PEZI|nr:hypothetical protein B0T17DRAFT_505220 [Bombardia bombarda]